MISARLAFGAALVLSGALHAAGAIAIAPQKRSLAVAGAGSATVSLLGEAFEDLAQGARPVTARTATVAPPLPSVAVTAQASPVVSKEVSLAPVPAATPGAPDPVLPALSPTPAQAVDPAAAAPDASPRPRQRAQIPQGSQASAAPKKAQAAASHTAGNADRTARKGAQNGQDSARSSAIASGKAGPKTRSNPSGTAQSSAYPGLVLRKIERTRKLASPARGTVVVAFSVAPSGALAAARVARSTGDPVLERAALDHIRRAAPFPPPPRGAETDFRFEFIGRR